MSLCLVEVSWSDANRYVARWHRHSEPVAGGIAAALVVDDTGWARGAAILGRPVSRVLQERGILEVNRVATDGTRNACSMLYGWASRRAKRIGASGVVTYTRVDEPGTSLRAAGWVEVGRTQARKTGWRNRAGRRQHEAVAKIRWAPPWAVDAQAGRVLDVVGGAA